MITPSVESTEPLFNKTLSHEEGSTYRLQDTWLPVCGITIAIFSIFWGTFQLDPERYQDSKYTIYEPDGKGVLYWDRDFEHMWLSVVAIVAFVTSASGSVVSLYFVNHMQRPAIYCTLVINGMAALTHYSFAVGASPVFDSCFGRKMHTVRFAEWTSLVFLLMFVLNVIDKVDRKEFIRSCGCQVLSVALGSLSSFACHLNWGGDDIPQSDGHWMHRGVGYKADSAWYHPIAIYNSSRSFKICLILLIISFISFCNIYRVAWTRLTNRQLTSSSVGRLAIWCAVSWSIVVFIYILGCFHWFNSDVEFFANVIIDLCSKVVYAHVLADTQHHLQDVEVEFSAKLKAKDMINESQTHFLRYVFHEVRVPLNTIRLGLDSIHMAEQESGVSVDADLKYVFSCMDNATETMSDTLDDVLAYQKIKEGKIDFKVSCVKLREVVRDVTDQFEVNFQDMKLKIGVLVDPLIPSHVQVDGLRVRQVLSHFISSVIKNHQARNIIVSIFKVRRECGQLGHHWFIDKLQGFEKMSMKFSVHIDGVYIAPEDQADLFEAYTQIRTGDLVVGDGTSGLGLCICKRLVEIMGGTVGVDGDKNGCSSAFFFTLPLVEASECESTDNTPSESMTDTARDNVLPVLRRIESAKSAIAVSKPMVATPKAFSPTKVVSATTPVKPMKVRPKAVSHEEMSQKASQKPHPAAEVKPKDSATTVSEEKRRDVLVVDDVKLNRRLMKRCVDQLNFDCDEAEHGKMALEMCEVKAYDLILMDNSMPIMTGVEATKLIRAKYGASILVFGVTGNALSEDVAEFKQAGCNEVLLKPLDFNQFLRYLVKHGLDDEKVKSLSEKVKARSGAAKDPRDAPKHSDFTN